jgi:hypothetical protein
MIMLEQYTKGSIGIAPMNSTGLKPICGQKMK